MSQDAFNIIIVLCSYGVLSVIILCCFIVPLMAAIKALFNAYAETKHLSKSKKNKKRLDKAIEQLENGQGKSKKIIDKSK